MNCNDEEIIINSADEEILYGDLEHWMTKLPSKLRALPFIQLAIPGSHNSMTYTIKRNNDVGPDESSLIRFLGKYFSYFVKPLVFNWSVNQLNNVVEQLNGGIRYLDLRLSVKNTDEICFVHGLYGSEITGPLQEIVNWLDTHFNEIIVLDFQHFYKFNEIHHQRCIEYIKKIFGNKACPLDKLDKISLEWLNFHKYQVFIIYRNAVASNYSFMWPSSLWPTPWPNTVNPNRLENFLSNSLENRISECAFVSQCLLTPDASYILKHIFGNLYNNLGIKCRLVSFSWIKENVPGKGGINIVITDYVSFKDYLFSKIVIQRNSMLL